MGGRSHFFELIAQEAMMGIIAFSESTMRSLYLNSLALEALELMAMKGEEQVIDVQSLYVENDRPGLGRAFSAEMLRTEGFMQDVLLKKANGHTMIANLGIKRIQTDEQGTTIVIMFQDITLQKKLQREVQAKQEEIHKAYTELLEQNRQLKELDLAKDKFIALTTHELRTPLSAIVATVDVLKMELYESEEQKSGFINTIYDQAILLSELVNDILDFAKIRAGKMEYFVEHVEVGPILENIIGSFQQMAQQASVKLEFDRPQVEMKVYVDVLRLREVINNIVNNAIKYNKENGTVQLRAVDEGKSIKVSVRDTGQGISQDKLKNVFNEFETVGSVSKHHKGTGLGMPISKKLIEEMGGSIALESEEGVGSTFTVTIPKEKVLKEEMYRGRPDSWGDLAA